MNDAVAWDDCITADGMEVSLSAGIHMEAIVIPDTIDVILAMCGMESDPAKAMTRADQIIARAASPVNSDVAAWA